jgi:hypothetical protein
MENQFYGLVINGDLIRKRRLRRPIPKHFLAKAGMTSICWVCARHCLNLLQENTSDTRDFSSLPHVVGTTMIPSYEQSSKARATHYNITRLTRHSYPPQIIVSLVQPRVQLSLLPAQLQHAADQHEHGQWVSRSGSNNSLVISSRRK